MNFFVLIVNNPTNIMQQNITYDGFIYPGNRLDSEHA